MAYVLVCYSKSPEFAPNRRTKSVAPEHVGSSPYSQQPATGPYPELCESIPHTPSQSPQDPF
jgi:hypothetical protein